MMPLGHTLTINIVAVRMKNVPMRALAVFLTALAMHFLLLDTLPHIEPSLFGVSYLDPHHWTFYWTVVELLLSGLMTLYLFVCLPQHRVALAAGFLGALGPDFLEAFAKTFHVQGFEWLSALHFKLHWMNRHLPPIWAKGLGSITTLAACWIGLRFMPKPVSDNASDKVVATAVLT